MLCLADLKNTGFNSSMSSFISNLHLLVCPFLFNYFLVTFISLSLFLCSYIDVARLFCHFREIVTVYTSQRSSIEETILSAAALPAFFIEIFLHRNGVFHDYSMTGHSSIMFPTRSVAALNLFGAGLANRAARSNFIPFARLCRGIHRSAALGICPWISHQIRLWIND